MTTYYLGIDVGSVSTNIVLVDNNLQVYKKLYLRTQGAPVKILKKGLMTLLNSIKHPFNIAGVGTTGSGRQLAGVMVGADVIKNEITTHAVAALNYCPETKTILEIGGQDSKIIIVRDGIVYDFAMNTVCAAGTGSFLDRQAARLDIPISEFGKYALKSNNSIRIAGRCAVFAESDMIHKQQTGHKTEDIINGLCEALVRNYLNNLAKGKEIKSPILFQGGVAANIGIISAFEKQLGSEIIIPEHYDVMGAIGSAILAKEKVQNQEKTNFYGLEMLDKDYKARTFQCSDCANSCEVVEILSDNKPVARWGDRCGKWGVSIEDQLKISV